MTQRATPPLEARLGARATSYATALLTTYQRVDCGKCAGELARIINPDDPWARSLELLPGYHWNERATLYALTRNARYRSAHHLPVRDRRGNLSTRDGWQHVARPPHTLPVQIACPCGARQWLRAESLDVNAWERTAIDANIAQE